MWSILLAVIVPCRSSSSTSNQEEDFRRLMRIGNGKSVRVSELEDNDTSISGIGNNGGEMIRNMAKGHDIEFSVESDPVSPKPSRGHRHIQRDSEDGVSYSGGDRRSGQTHSSGSFGGDRSMLSDTPAKERERKGKNPDFDDESISVEGGVSKPGNAFREKGNGRSSRKHDPEETGNSQDTHPKSAKHGKASKRYKENESNRTRKKLQNDLDSESTQDRLPKRPAGGKKSQQKGVKREMSSPKDSEASSSNFVESIKKMKKTSKSGFR